METTKKYCIMLGFHQGLMLIASMLVKGRHRRVYSQNPLSCKLWVLTPASLYKTLVFLIFHHKGQKCRPQHSMLYPVLKSLAHRMNCYPKPKKKQPEVRRICLNDETTRSELVDHSEIKVLSQVKIPGSMWRVSSLRNDKLVALHLNKEGDRECCFESSVQGRRLKEVGKHTKAQRWRGINEKPKYAKLF